MFSDESGLGISMINYNGRGELQGAVKVGRDKFIILVDLGG